MDMNVTDNRLLEQMQQMAASMATSLPQVGASPDQPAKLEVKESFKDVLDKTKAQQTESTAQEGGATIKKSEDPMNQEAVRQAEPNKIPLARPLLTEGQKVTVSTEDAAMLAAGYAQLYQPVGQGPMMVVTAQDQNGTPVVPTPQDPETKGIIPGITDLYANSEQDWVMEPTPELTTAVARLLQQANDPRSAEDVINELVQKMESAPAGGSKFQVVIDDTAAENYATYGDVDKWDSEFLTAQAMNERSGLFRTVESGLVKVGDSYVVDTQEADADSQLAQIIQIAAEDGLKQVEIKLSPENLGSLTIKLTQNADGTLQVVMQVSNSKAADVLNKHLDGLNHALQNYVQGQEVRVEIQRNQDSQQAEQQSQQQADPDGHSQRQQQQEQQQQQQEHSEAFLQRMRLGLDQLDDED